MLNQIILNYIVRMWYGSVVLARLGLGALRRTKPSARKAKLAEASRLRQLVAKT